MRQTFEQFLAERQRGRRIAAGSGLSDHDLDLWEHGCLLFSAFEWEAAAELFGDLCQSIPGVWYSTACLLNSAIIHARLGDFSRASQSLDEAEDVEELLPLTLALMGHCEYELGNFTKSEDCFNIALQALESEQSYDHLGLDFVLREEQIQQNLAFLASPLASGMVGTFPGDIVFEAPPRGGNFMPADPADTSSWSLRSSTTSRSFSSRLSTAMSMIVPLVSRRPTEAMEGHNMDRTFEPIAPGASVSSSPKMHSNSLHSPTSPKQVTLIMRAVGKSVLARGFSLKRPTITKTHTTDEAQTTDLQILEKQLLRMEPRDARPAGNTTQGLSAFIQSLPNQLLKIPRDPRGLPGSTGDLAKFFRSTPQAYKSTSPTTASKLALQDFVLRDANRDRARAFYLPLTAKGCIVPDAEHPVEAESEASSTVSGVLPPLSQENSSSMLSKAESPQPVAVHPALRPGVSTNCEDNQGATHRAEQNRL